jgi:PAS domain S-box-containing protein
MAGNDWASMFAMAFRSSRNAMVLVDEQRCILDVNGALLKLIGYSRRDVLGHPVWEFVAGGPVLSQEQWAKELALGRFSGEASVVAKDGTVIAVQWGAATEVVTGKRLVLFVALSTSRWGGRFRREMSEQVGLRELSRRERDVVRLVAAGESGPEIADELGIAHDTVRTHVRNASKKLGARSRAHLVAKALGEGHTLD